MRLAWAFEDVLCLSSTSGPAGWLSGFQTGRVGHYGGSLVTWVDDLLRELDTINITGKGHEDSLLHVSAADVMTVHGCVRPISA